MERRDFTRHISKGFNKDLETVFNKTNDMLDLVETQLNDAINAFFSQDQETYQEIIRREEDVNKFDTDIFEECIRVIALRQPVASDMRLVMTVASMISHLETIGDKCLEIVRLSHEHGTKINAEDHPDILHYSLEIIHSLALNQEAFNNLDSLAALHAIKKCFESQIRHQSMTRKLILDIMNDGPLFKVNLNLLWFINILAEINDNTGNIAKALVYLIKGKDMKHKDINEIEKEIKGYSF